MWTLNKNLQQTQLNRKERKLKVELAYKEVTQTHGNSGSISLL